MAYILGWKDILRPIRDGYRHLFPSPDTGPSPEEREKQRQADRLKGFAYFDSFEQLEQWSAFESYPFQRSNTPLLRRQSHLKDHEAQADVLLCHDYSGNYHEYESAQGVGVDAESYTCEYLQNVETFIYFSHKLVCIPPPTWTNTLHRNGVKSLGTVLIEPQTKGAETLLQRNSGIDFEDVDTTFLFARRLADISHHYGFDGWLVNIEKSFPNEAWNSDTLRAFLCQLKTDLGPMGQLIWYDAITTTNKISYQNALTERNAPYSSASGSILTNYSWKEKDAWSSKQVAQQNDISFRKIFFGVDVWAQNAAKFAHPRVTYPEQDGGGTNTGLAIRKLAEVGLSVGVFAPAWSFEHFPDHGRQMEKAIWEGIELPEGIVCDCGNVNARHPPNRDNPMLRFATRYPAGSETFFYTDFSRGFCFRDEKEDEYLYEGKRLQSQLGSQSVLPLKSRTDKGGKPAVPSSNGLLLHLEDGPGRTLLAVDVRGRDISGDHEHFAYEQWLPIFEFDMPADGSLQLKVSCSYKLRNRGMVVKLYQQFDHGRKLSSLEEVDGIQEVEVSVAPNQAFGPERLRGIGIYLQGMGSQGVVRVLEVFAVSITPRPGSQPPISADVSRLKVEHRGSDDVKHTRLCWEFQLTSPRASVKGFPFSEVTGPFSHFLIYVGEALVGRAYALEYVLGQSLVDRLTGIEGVKVDVVGIGFNGASLAECSSFLRV